MDKIVPLMNELHSVFAPIRAESDDQETHWLDNVLNLPRIVAIGSQSSGKSSVIESLVGKDFLPRGKDIVTRRPLVLQLHRADSGTAEYGMFAHRPGRIYEDFGQIRKEIEGETMRIAGNNKGISASPIYLSIYSPKVVNLVLVDLPGMTKIPVGDQPPDIETQVRNLVLQYIAPKNTLILAVTPANNDLVNSEALKMARQVDPGGLRTLGVVTKIDLMDAGTDAIEILSNRASFTMRYGFVGVVCRSQQDIITNKPMEEALRAEGEFFRSHPAYRSVATKCGTAYLAVEMNKILGEHIRVKLPEIKMHLQSKMLQLQNDYIEYGEGEPSQQKGTLLLKLLTCYVSDFSEAIHGTTGRKPSEHLVSSGGAQINQIFNQTFAAAMLHLNGASGLTLGEVRRVIRNSSGPRPAIFVPEASFEVLMRRQISKFEPPVLQCVELVYEELYRLTGQCLKKELRRFPKLAQKLTNTTCKLLEEQRGPTLEMVQNLVKIELAYINTNHPDFWKAVPALATLPQTIGKAQMLRNSSESSVEEDDVAMQSIQSSIPPSPKQSGPGLFSYLFRSQALSSPTTTHPQATTPNKRPFVQPPVQQPPAASVRSEGLVMLSEKEEFETQLIMTLIHSYFGIVRKNLMDTVPKSIMHFLVNATLDNLPAKLVCELYREELLGELLKEDDGIRGKRTRIRKELEAYRQALTMISTQLNDTQVY